MRTKWQTTALLVILIASFLSITGCQKQEAPAVYPAKTTQAIVTGTPETISTSYPTAAPTSTIIPTPFNDIRKTLAPNTYAVYWSQGTWYLKGLTEVNRTELITGIISEVNTNLELSPDNNQVAFSSSSGKLSIYNLHTGEIASYYNPEVNSIEELEWLPNSDTILYLGTPEEIWVPDSNVGLYSVSLKSKELDTLLDWKDNHDLFRYGLHGITLSKDGKWLSFYASRLSEMMAPDPEYGVYLINTGCLQNPTTCSETVRFIGDGYSPAWSPGNPPVK